MMQGPVDVKVKMVNFIQVLLSYHRKITKSGRHELNVINTNYIIWTSYVRSMKSIC